MKTLNLRNIIIGLAMVAAAGLALAITPTHKLADQGQKLDLEKLVPKQFGDWTLDTTVVPLTVSPDVQANLDRIYSQTLSRTYVNKQDERVMLSIAYGGDQGRSTQVHKPEVCYPAQGFQIKRMAKEFLDTSFGTIPVMHLVATQGSRTEPITYWIRVGDSVVRGALEQNLARIKYGLTGKVPDGLLFRVSTISSNEHDSYRIQQAFVTSMLQAVPSADRVRLVGKLGS